ncbi:SRPBCC domain-containing protein [Streptomyces sp. NPDC020403]|uniref:SRPBCC domain-containing protein n=1 Tax=unclassified Streptomyces TaxID=2593676 RepID=UPI0034117086
MEHEVFVPVPVASLRRTLGDPARVARCVPGFQQEADAAAGPLAGRLKLRIGGHTITYRGSLTLRPSGTGFSVTGEGAEARGTGSARLALTIGLTESDGGTTIGFAGTASGDGRIVDLEEDAALAAAHRLLDRLTQQLVTESLASRDGADAAPDRDATARDAEEPGAASAAGATGRPAADAPTGDAPVAEAPAGDAPVADVPEDAPQEVPAEEKPAAGAPAPGSPAEERLSGERPSEEERPSGERPSEEEPGSESVFDAPVPPSALDPAAELEFTVPDEPPAEAAHARRTMIGRSTEEVDHAPPRGRYAPVPSTDTSPAGLALRWAAPAAALAIASAVVIGRALRRRR